MASEKKPLEGEKRLARLAGLSRGVEKVFDRIVGLLLLLIILFAGYSLRSSYKLYRGGFTSDEIMKYKPYPTEDGKNPTLRDLMKINPDVVGRITVDDTHIDHPIVQGKDNQEYINKDIYGKFALPGAIFLDYRNNKHFEDPYSLLYGHHMDGGGMFGDLVLFEDKKYFDSHKTGTLYLPDETYRVEFFMVSKVDAYDGRIFDPTLVGDMSQRESFLEYARTLVINKREVDIKDDRLLALSTCERATTNGRTVLFGVMRKVGGSAEKTK